MDGALWLLCDLAVSWLLWVLLRYRGVNPLLSLAPLAAVLLLEGPIGRRRRFRPSPLAGFVAKGILSVIGRMIPRGKPLLEWDDRRIDRMKWEEFERFVGRLFELQGYSVTYTPHNDQGVDVVVEKGSLRMAVQCKHYAAPVGVQAVQEVYAGLRPYRCQHGLVVTTSSFTAAAVQLAKHNGVGLWNRQILKREVLRVRTPADASRAPWWRTDGPRRLAALLLGKWVYHVSRARDPME